MTQKNGSAKLKKDLFVSHHAWIISTVTDLIDHLYDIRINKKTTKDKPDPVQFITRPSVGGN